MTSLIARAADAACVRRSILIGVPPVIKADRLQCLDNVLPAIRQINRQWTRWTGPNAAFTIFLPVERSQQWRVSLECSSGASSANWENIFVSFEAEMQLCSHEVITTSHIVSVIVQPRVGGGGVVLRYQLQETRELPREFAEQVPEGPVGLCISAVRIEAV
jgi:hypothetical protein